MAADRSEPFVDWNYPIVAESGAPHPVVPG